MRDYGDSWIPRMPDATLEQRIHELRTVHSQIENMLGKLVAEYKRRRDNNQNGKVTKKVEEINA